MLSTSALTWAAAQDRISVYELIRSLSPTDERLIEAAYSEWRRRAAAGERRHKVDWRSFPVEDDISGEREETAEAKPAAAEPVAIEPATDVAAVPVPDEPVLADPVPAVEAKPVPDDPVRAVETNEAEETVSDPISAVETSETEDLVPTMETSEAEEPFHAVEERETDREADQAAIEAVTEILEEEQIDGDYISLDDFNLEPSEAEMQAMEEAIKADELLTEDVSEDDGVAGAAADEATADEATEAGTIADDDASKAEAAVAEARKAATAEAGKAEATERAVAVDETVKLRISRLRKDVPTSVFEELLVSLASNIEVAKAVTEAVIKDHTKRHKGTAPQRAFLAWLNER